jgi:hypothetical protein
LCSTGYSEVTIMAWFTSGQLFCWNILVDGCNLHKGGIFMCFSSKTWCNKSREMICIATLFMLFVKCYLGKKVKIFLWKIEHHTQRHMREQR